MRYIFQRGHFRRQDEAVCRGGDDGCFFEGGPEANLKSYIEYQRKTGSTILTVTLPTTPEQEEAIKEKAMEIGDSLGSDEAVRRPK